MKETKPFRMNDLFQSSLKWIINILILYIILVLAIGLAKTMYSVTDLFQGKAFGSGFSRIITDILTFLVILELFRSFVEYFKAKRFRLHAMMDPFIIFVVREFMVILYSHEQVHWENIFGFAALILSLGVVRTLAVVFSPDEAAEET